MMWCNHSRSDGSAHRFVGDAQEASSDLFKCQFVLLPLRAVDLDGELVEQRPAGFDVESFILVRPEDFWAGVSEYPPS